MSNVGVCSRRDGSPFRLRWYYCDYKFHILKFVLRMALYVWMQYDLSVSTFSPDGRVFQVEYAQKSVDSSG